MNNTGVSFYLIILDIEKKLNITKMNTKINVAKIPAIKQAKALLGLLMAILIMNIIIPTGMKSDISIIQIRGLSSGLFLKGSTILLRSSIFE